MDFCIEFNWNTGFGINYEFSSNFFFELFLGWVRIGIYRDSLMSIVCTLNVISYIVSSKTACDIIIAYQDCEISHEAFVNKLTWEKRKYVSSDDEAAEIAAGGRADVLY